MSEDTHPHGGRDRHGVLEPGGGSLLGMTLAVGLLVGLLVVAFVGARPVPAAGTGSQPGAAAPGGSAGPFDLELGEFFIKPASITVPAGKEIVLNVSNTGQQQHTLALKGGSPETFEPGQSRTVRWPALDASTEAWCTVAGHKDSGMAMKVVVEGAAESEGSAGAAEGDAADGDAAGGTDKPTIDATKKPGPEWRAFDPALRPAPGGRTHEVTFRAREKVMEVAPGVTQKLWTFNDQVPGPTLRGRVGDVFTVTLVNEGTMEHSLDFHASKVAPNVEMRPIKPGESLKYQFTANYAGIFYYHCGADPMIYHIGNGMFGAVIIDPPGLGKVDKEFLLVQSELYLGPSGQPGDLTAMKAERSDAVVFNGYVNQYLHAPITVSAGDRVRVWVLDAGINENSSFHIVGTIFDTAFKEGSYLLRPDRSRGGSQTLDLLPAQGGFVEFTLDRAGTYPVVTHKMANMAKGGLGVFQVKER